MGGAVTEITVRSDGWLDADGRRLTHVPGYMSPERILPLLEFINTKAYEEQAYDDWLKRRS